MKAAGIALLVIGVLLTLFTSIKYFTREEVLEIGKLEVTKEKPHTVAWSPLIGVGIMAIGGVMLFMGAKK